MCEPTGGIPFIFTFVGRHGRRRLRHEPRGRFGDGEWRAVAIQAEKYRHAGRQIVAREIMQHAHNLDEALEKILRDAKVFVSTIWLVGSRA